LAELRREAAKKYERTKAAAFGKSHGGNGGGAVSGASPGDNAGGVTLGALRSENRSSATLQMPAPKAPIAQRGSSPRPGERKVRKADDIEELSMIEIAQSSPAVQHAVEVLTDPGSRTRGCIVDPDRPALQALQKIVVWTLGGYDTRPTQEVENLKHHDRLQVLLRYRQPLPNPGEQPRVAMYDYLCETLFAVPMRPISDPAQAMPIKDLDGNILMPNWVEPDWEAFGYTAGVRREVAPVFKPNRYPYQLPVRELPESCHEFQRQTQHWILWYHHYPDEEMVNPIDEVIDSDIRCELTALVTSHGFEAAFDFVWYRNPGMSVPDMFHVQVFWIVPEV